MSAVFIETEPARLIHDNPQLLAFIPDERFKGTLLATIAGSMRGLGNATSSLMTAVISGGASARDNVGATVTIWTWSAGEPVTGRTIGNQARWIATATNKTRRVKRLTHDVFTSTDGAGIASCTTYRIVKGDYER
jgi:hypothetical protein